MGQTPPDSRGFIKQDLMLLSVKAVISISAQIGLKCNFETVRVNSWTL
jgi:hypothetical protein